MTSRKRLKATRFLVILGLVLSYGSYGIYKLGGPLELYPFFSWRLYSAPTGADEATMHRLYVQHAPGEPWHRLPVRATPAYPRKEYVWQFESLVREVVENTPGEAEARERLDRFVSEVAPDAAAARVVAETVYPRALLRGNSAYDTTTVYRVTW